MYKPNDKFDISATWVYCTGNTATLALHEFERKINTKDYYEDYYYDSSLPYLEGRNNFRMPAYHRLDIGMNFHKKKKHGIRTWSLSVYNVYNRHNPYMVYQDGNKLMQLSIFPIIPSVSYQYKF